MLQKMPKRIIADHQAAVGQLPEESAQREIRLLGDPRQNPIALARHKVRPATAHPQRGRTADGALALRPLHNAGDADHERLGHRTAGLTRRDSRHHTLPQVQRISSRHPRWPPNPASRLNLTRALLGIPFDSVKADRALGFSRRNSLLKETQTGRWSLLHSRRFSARRGPLGPSQGSRTVAVARQAIPSPRPAKPRRSVVVALTATRSTPRPAISATRAHIASRCGPIFGASQISVASRWGIAPPRARTRSAA